MVAVSQNWVTRPDNDVIWAWISQVPDPEVPVVSVVDLGIVRDVRWQEDTLQVVITPTYSGCPATSVIALDIERALLKNGVKKVSVTRVLSPPWSTKWISEEGRKKLLDYGIAPPVEGTSCAGMIGRDASKSVTIKCPQCNSSQTELVSQFGSTPCKAAYRCKTCLEPFDYFKAF